MPSSDGKLWTASVANDANDETSIAAASILRVLEGVAVATKAPDEYVQPLAQWLRRYGVVEGNDSPLGITAIDTKSALDLAIPFGEWRAAINSSSENCNEGVRQLAQVTLAVALLREKARRGLDVDTASLDTIWSLIHEAIISAQGTKVQFTVSRSAQGFLAVPLCSLLNDGRIEELWRLHTWLPDGQRGVSEEVCIHAHQPFGQSWTLLGCGTDCTFEVDSPNDPSLTTHAAYECCYAGADGKQITPVSREPHSRDMTYIVPGGAYHRSIVSGSRLHATLFVFDAHRGYDDTAAVLGPKDVSEYFQPRDPAGITPEALAQMVGATRKWEQAQGVKPEGNDEHATVMGYYRFFRGLGLLQAGRREDALQYFNPAKGCTPAQAFAQEPSQQHRDYIKKLIESGYKALDYAVHNGDTKTEALILGRSSAAFR
ncbi:hypothetical protein K469DRAFT_735688 [Zopfia rhizophila CBS 207.26]|uniref:Uncharacterized protein n=1 Tax=Zopfia rhizophila CBS 207.26 TaxID=1314779 RepID=A0A6A6EQ49_9PEZI|nr:hypothetical protein K469DRAFT_735688 [Zopfia rhizophila CBS 207.26]